MPRVRESAKYEEWRNRLERFAKSGQTVSAFCRAEGVSTPSFYRWRGELGLPRSNRRPAKPGRQRKSSAFMRLRVSPTEATSGVSIRLPSGIVVELGSDLKTIEKIVGQLLDRQASKGTG